MILKCTDRRPGVSLIWTQYQHHQPLACGSILFTNPGIWPGKLQRLWPVRHTFAARQTRAVDMRSERT